MNHKINRTLKPLCDFFDVADEKIENYEEREAMTHYLETYYDQHINDYRLAYWVYRSNGAGHAPPRSAHTLNLKKYEP